ncbi:MULTISPECIES: hypothetical protein [Paraburkholderia]|uniref:hypothetical protein n=1 Tax=Paraburkholderia TaxID=1822464 RepID=UPI002250A688|nr:MULTISPECIES: hypothetical protein [Paraburkholderia]MCX4177382.1 hypothetical protein [Paraburkholderia madseniana]MDQ6465370.1 hypothetical protein [Paraburkholderia madseniana]
MTDEFDEKSWSLSAVLQVADNEDLDILVDHLTDSGKGRSTLSTVCCQQLLACRSAGVYGHSDRNLMADEIRLFGGNSVANTMRGGEGASYHEIVGDAAKHLKLDVHGSESVPYVEAQILRRLLLDALDGMSDAQRRSTLSDVGLGDLPGTTRAEVASALREAPLHGDVRLNVAAFVADSTATSVLGRGIAVGAKAGLAPTIAGGLALGTAFIPLALVFGVVALASAAYRVTVPCVIQVAYIRQKAYHKRVTGVFLDVVGAAASSEKKPWMPPAPKLELPRASYPKVGRIKSYPAPKGRS